MNAPASSSGTQERQPARLGIVGGGDIANRTYVPLLKRVPDADIVGVYDRSASRAMELVESLRERWPDVKAVNSVEALRTEVQADGIYNLTPAFVHHEVTRAALEAGLHVYSEKPLAPSVSEASALIELAKQKGLLLQSAPGVVASPRFKWLSNLIDSGDIGTPHLVTAQLASLGPARWAPYTSDPRPFYDVGPLVDEGVYAIHWLTGLLGPATKVQAMGSIAIPERVTRTLASSGVAFTVKSPDQILIHLTFAAALGQLLSSFAVVGTRAPSLEIHTATASLSLEDFESSWGSAMLFEEPADGDDPAQEWREVGPDPEPQAAATANVIEDGAEHFVAALNKRTQPLLSAEHARHMVEIIAAVNESVESGDSVALNTTFELPRTKLK
jgi:predicted dehydrogenase